MPELHETEWKQMLKNGDFPRVCLLYEIGRASCRERV